MHWKEWRKTAADWSQVVLVPVVGGGPRVVTGLRVRRLHNRQVLDCHVGRGSDWPDNSSKGSQRLFGKPRREENEHQTSDGRSILLVAGTFPPENRIAGVRAAKFAEEWTARGYRVCVLTAKARGEGLERVDEGAIEIMRTHDPVGPTSAKLVSVVEGDQPSPRVNLLAAALGLGRALLWPDRHSIWALGAFLRSLSWGACRPDVVVATVPSLSTLLLGYALCRRHKVPLVVDYRDLLTDNHHYNKGGVRRQLESWVESRLTGRAALVAGVSAPMVELLHRKYGRPTVQVMNGYDPGDFEGYSYEPRTGPLRIVYAGTVYSGAQELAPFFKAVRSLVDSGANLRVDFYGQFSAVASGQVSELDLGRVVTEHGRVSHGEAVRRQAEADLLLLLIRGSQGERSVLSGKIFEYIGARRPVLCVGASAGAAPDLIHSTGIGVALTDEADIRKYLESLVRVKMETGRVEHPTASPGAQYTREFQSRRFLEEIEVQLGWALANGPAIEEGSE